MSQDQIPNLPGALFGKDVSHFQTPSDWTPEPLTFLIARASIGTQPDEMYDRHIIKALDAGLAVGAYHFNVGSGISVAAQAKAFLEAAGEVDLYVIDVEGKDPFTPDQAREFIDRVQQAGKQIGLYHSTSGYPENAWGANWRWVADWRDGIAHPPIPWDIWQFGNVGGEDGDLVKDRATLNRIIGKDADVTPDTITNESPMILDLNKGDKVFDLDGETVITTMSGARTDLQSPYGAGSKRATFITTGGLRRITLVVPRNLRPDPTTKTPADVANAAKAAADATRQELQASIDAAHAQHVADQVALAQAAADLATAATNERERIAVASGAAEAGRIRNI